MSTALAGTAPLLRTTLHHDGRSFAPWILIVTVLATSSVLVYPWVFPSQQDRAGLATAIGANPALGLIFGPAYDLSTADGFTAWRSLALGGFLVALGAIFTVTRATRGQEDSGQAELLASGVLGRSSRLLAGVGMALIGSLLLGIVAGVATALCGGAWDSSLLLGGTFAATGWMFAAIAAVTAQIGSDLRTANSLAVGTLGVLFLLRGFLISISAPEWAVWANPLGWMTQTRPATENNWWPLLFAVVFTLVLLAIAFALQARRDFGQGAIAPRQGPARGRIRSPLRLALRIHGGPVLTWTIAFLALGVMFGYFTSSITDLLGADSGVTQMLASGGASSDTLVSVFLVTILSLVGIIATIPGVQSVLKARAEEMDDRVEPVIAAGIRRSRYFGSNVLVAFAAPTAYVLIAGAIIAALASNADIGIDYGSAFLQALATVPAVWTVIALAVAVVGARPQVTLAAWFGVLASFVLTLLGPTFKLPDGALAISPFWHIPLVSSVDLDLSGLVWITVVTLVLGAIGFAGFRRRDLAR
ncbi:ABC transporter permease [Cryobacterium psychrophilum]|uniref:Multidrug ABC transporter permease n=1 Tax=Cryobacterium psychrophilum TaxID=41988 RepID=A0A4Y8KWP3_9MICO|nr:ABC transporter permease [Cryobacterium psychrophilum]TDW28750.1 ABC-2 type transport system permease protein [Cryobacterium psychrophilum]TFD82405.1 multidrug ABC transporter permease [Cryobacterium psychrophilum]